MIVSSETTPCPNRHHDGRPCILPLHSAHQVCRFALAAEPDEPVTHLWPTGESPRPHQCPEGLLLGGVDLYRCVANGGHEGKHWSRGREHEWNPVGGPPPADDDLSAPDFGRLTQSDLDTAAYISGGGLKSSDASLVLDDEFETAEDRLAEARAETERIRAAALDAFWQQETRWEAELGRLRAELQATKNNRVVSAIFGHHKGAPKPFALYRREDQTGVSGTGVVATGCEFDDGTAALRWRSQYTSTAVYASMGDVEAVHGHGGRTQIVWLSDELEPLAEVEQQRDRALAEVADADAALRRLGDHAQHLVNRLTASRSIVEKAKAWRAWFATLHPDFGMFIPENELAAGVDALGDGDLTGVHHEHPETYCHRCAGPNLPWAAPSPLWNEVMRGDINNTDLDQWDGIVCPTCFMVLAEEAGIAEIWRLYAERVHRPLQTVTPSGRIWNEQTWRFEEPGDALPFKAGLTHESVTTMLRRYLAGAADFQRAGNEHTDDIVKHRLWEEATLAGMCAFVLNILNAVDPLTARVVVEDLERFDHDGSDLADWVHVQLAADGAASHVAPTNSQTWEQVLAEVAAERQRQDAKWGEQNHPDGTGVSWPEMVIPAFGWSSTLQPAHQAAHLARKTCQRAAKDGRCTWLAIALEEVAEAFAETDPARLRAELIQVAAVAVAWVEAIDRREAADIRAGQADEEVAGS